MHVGIEVFEQLDPGLGHGRRDLFVEFALQLVERVADLIGGAAPLVDLADPFLDVDARFERPQHIVGGSEDPVEELEFLVQQFKHPQVGLIRPVDEVDDHHVVLLAIAVAAADALFDALRVPGKIVIDHQRAELQVDPFGGRLGGDHDGGGGGELFHQGGPHVGRGGPAECVLPGVPLQPLAVDAFRLGVGVGAVEQHDLPGIPLLFEQLPQVRLGPPRFGEDEGLGGGPQFARFGEPQPECLEQRGSLGVLGDRLGQRLVLRQLERLGPNALQNLGGRGGAFGGLGALGRAVWTGRFGQSRVFAGPFLFDRLGLFEVVSQHVGDGLGVRGLVRCRFGGTPRGGDRDGGLFELVEPADHGAEGGGDGERRRGENLAQHQFDELSLAAGEGVQGLPLEVGRDLFVQPLFLTRRGEVFGDGDAAGVADVLDHLLAEGALADGGEPGPQVGEQHGGEFFGLFGVAFAERLFAAEDMLVDEGGEAEEFHQRVLQRRGGEQNLGAVAEGVAQGAGDLVVFLVDVAQPVGFVDDHQIPRHSRDFGGATPGELVRADHHLLRRHERRGMPARQFAEALRFEQHRRQKELLGQFAAPLLAERGGGDDQNAAAVLGPQLADDQPGFNGFAQPHLIGQNGPA